MYDLPVELIFAGTLFFCVFFLNIFSCSWKKPQKSKKLEPTKISCHKVKKGRYQKQEKHEKNTKQQDATNLKPLFLPHFYPDCKKYIPINIPNVTNQM